jgi:hypothetical protein
MDIIYTSIGVLSFAHGEEAESLGGGVVHPDQPLADLG